MLVFEPTDLAHSIEILVTESFNLSSLVAVERNEENQDLSMHSLKIFIFIQSDCGHFNW